jgi:type II secretory pathway pseudopilin PulG
MHMTGGSLARAINGVKRSKFFGREFGGGFTIIEVLIVLAVTGALFVSAAILIAGRQQQTEFNQGIRQVQAQIQQVINEVAIGHYPNQNNFQCTAGASGPVITAGSGTEQGANSGCIFLGKAMQFGITNTSPERFVVFSVAGLQRTPAGKEVTTLAEALPKAVAPNSSQNLPDASVTQQLQGGLTTYRMWYNSGGIDRNIGVVAFVSSLAKYSSGNIVSGSQQVNVVPVDDNQVDSALDRTPIDGADAINASLATSPNNPAGGMAVFLCFASGGTNQSGLITIGNTTGRQLSVTLDIKSNKTCA